MLGDERGEHVGVRDRGPVRLGRAELGEAGAHLELVLGVAQRVGTGSHRDALADHESEYVLRHVLVIEGDHVDAASEREHGLRVAVVADCGRSESGRGVRGLREDAELDPEPHRGGDHHPGELAAPDDSDAHRHDTTLPTAESPSSAP